MTDLQGKERKEYVVFFLKFGEKAPTIYGLDRRFSLMEALELIERLAMEHGDFDHATLHSGTVRVMSQDQLNSMR